MTILVTGATGQLGRLAIDSLLARGAQPAGVIAGVRDVAKASDLADRGVRVVHLDYTDAASIAAALDGVDSVLLVSSSEVGQRFVQHKAVIDAAVAAGVSKFVYTSAPQATTSDLILAPEHKATEEAIVASGLPAVILRNNWYHENQGAQLAQAAEHGGFSGSSHDGRIASAARADYADAAAVVLLADGHIGEVYELAGETAWTADELATTIGEVLGREVTYTDLSREDHAALLTGFGLDEGTVFFVTELDAGVAAGALSHAGPTLAELIGRPTTPLAESLRALV